jgi:hypothetical protein
VFGSLKNRSQRALDSRSSFFVNKQPYLLYLWEVLENHDLLVSSMQRLNSIAIAANGADGITLVIDKKASCDESSGKQRDKFSAKKLNELSNTMMKCVQREKDRQYAMQAEVRASLCTLNAEKRQMTIQMEAERVKKNKVMEQVYADAIAEIEKKEAEEQALLNETVSTPQKSNRSPTSN